MTTLVNNMKRVLSRSKDVGPVSSPVESPSAGPSPARPQDSGDMAEKTEKTKRSLKDGLFRRKPKKPSTKKVKPTPEVDEDEVRNKIEEGQKWKNDVIKKKDAEKKKHDEHLQEKLDAKSKGKNYKANVSDSPVGHIAIAAQVGDSLRSHDYNIAEDTSILDSTTTSEADVQTCESFAYISPEGDTITKVKAEEEEPITENIPISKTKLEMLQKKQFAEEERQKMPGLLIAVDEEKSTVAFIGLEAKVKQVVANLQELLDSLVEIRNVEDPSVLGLIQLKDAQDHIHGLLAEKETTVTWEVSGQELVICAESEADAQSVLDLIHTELVHREIPVEDHQEILIGVDQWTCLLDDLHQQFPGLLLPIAVQLDEEEAGETKPELSTEDRPEEGQGTEDTEDTADTVEESAITSTASEETDNTATEDAKEDKVDQEQEVTGEPTEDKPEDGIELETKPEGEDEPEVLDTEVSEEKVLEGSDTQETEGKETTETKEKSVVEKTEDKSSVCETEVKSPECETEVKVPVDEVGDKSPVDETENKVPVDEVGDKSPVDETEDKVPVMKIHIAAVRHVADDVQTELVHFLENFSWDRTLDISAGLARVLYKGLQMDIRRIEKDCSVTIETTGHGVQTRLVVSGQSKAQMEAEKRLREVMLKVVSREYKVCRPGLAKFFLSEIGLEFLGRQETKYRLAIHPELGQPDLDAVTMATGPVIIAKPKHPLWEMFNSTEETTKLITKEEMVVNLVPGDITALQSDAILNSTTSRLNLSAGVLSAAILKAAGPEMRKDCYHVTPWFGLREGQVVSTPGRALPCQHILHAAGYPYTKNKQRAERVLRLILTNALLKAGELGCTSVAFPPFGCGKLGVPPASVARILLEQVVSYSMTSQGSPKVKDVSFVVRPEDTDVWEALLSEFTDLSTTPRVQSHMMPDGRRRRHHQDFPSLLEGYMSSLPRSVGDGSALGSVEGATIHPASSVIFHLHSLAEDTLDLAQEAIQKRCDTESQTFVIGGESEKERHLAGVIKKLQPDQVHMLEEIGASYSVLVTVDQSSDQGLIQLRGLDNDIVYVVEHVNGFLKEAQKLNSASKLSTKVQWQYETEDTYHDYSPEINRVLESALLSKQFSAQWSEKKEDGATITYIVNFTDMTEAEKGNTGNAVRVRRNTFREPKATPTV